MNRGWDPAHQRLLANGGISLQVYMAIAMAWQNEYEVVTIIFYVFGLSYDRICARQETHSKEGAPREDPAIFPKALAFPSSLFLLFTV